MKKLNRIAILLLLASLLFSYSVTAQEYKIQGNQIVKIDSTTKVEPIKTNLIHTVKGKDYPVYKSARNKYFIIRTSKNTGKTYKQYLKIS
jgi:hypothetical protein